MKSKKNVISIFIFVCSAAFFHNISAVLTISQYKPDSFFQKPYFLQDEFNSISTIFSGGFAHQAYSHSGQKVPYLQQFGSEDLLARFTDPSLPIHDTQSMGQGLLTANFHIREMILSCYKNIQHGFFIEAATVIQDLCMNSISVTFQPSSPPLTDEQITYLQTLQHQLPSRLGQSGMFTTAFYAGYNKNYCNFKHLDFIDITVKVGFTSPQAMTNNTNNLLQFPFNENLNVGYPLIASASLGVLDWMTIGCNSSIIPWQSTTKTIAMNPMQTNNTILIAQSGVAKIQRGPLITASIYLEADHFHQGLSTVVGYTYNKNYAYTITPINQAQFPQDVVQQSPLFDAWSLGALYLQFDVDFACPSTPSAPVLSMFCSIPVAGQLCPKTNIFGGSCNLQISYIF